MIRALASLTFAIVTLAGTLPAAAQQDRIPNLITVTGEGEVSVAPDLAVLGGGVTTTGKTAREASEANAKLMNAVMGALNSAGIADQDVQTSRLSLYPVRDNKNNITSFQATNQVSIKLRDVTKVADVLDRLVSAGANDISGIQFVVSSPSKLLDEARTAAMADAKRKAEIYAKAGSVILGPPVIISEDSAAMPEPVVMMRSSKAAADTPVSPGEQTQRVTVTVSYELQR